MKGGEPVVKFMRGAIISLSVIMIIAGIPNAYGSPLSGTVLHAWSHDEGSSYTEIHDVNRALGSGDVYAIEQVVMAANYSGSAGVVLLEIQAKNSRGRNRWYSFYWYGKDEVVIDSPSGSQTISLDMSVPHTYRIEVTRNSVTFSIDGGSTKVTLNADVSKVEQINVGRWDTGSIYDLYIDNVKEYWNGQLITSEDFEDGQDNFYTDDVFRGRGDSGEEIISSEEVPEFPFLKDVIEYLSNLIG